MADKPASERTEQPTAERLRKARREGRIPASEEVPSALAIIAIVVLGVLAGPGLCRCLAGEVRAAVTCELPRWPDARAVSAHLWAMGARAVLMLLPFLAAGAFTAVLGSLAVSGWTIAPKNVAPNFGRIALAQGFKNLLSLRSLVRLLVSMVKLLLIAVTLYFYLRDRLGTCLALTWATPAGCLAVIGRLVLGVLARIAVVLVGVGLADGLFQRWKYRRDLRMTRQEMKEEVKEHELSPQVRGRIRSMQIALARKRMLNEVPGADFVVVNPTHVAAALKYDAKVMDAPQLVAKGAGVVAEKIKEIAVAHGVPIVHRPELARTLYQTVEIGQFIPEALFVAVAEVLAMIQRLRMQRQAAGRRGPR